MEKKFQPIRIQDILNRIDQRNAIKVITPTGNLISRLDDRGKLSAAEMIINGKSEAARSLFLEREWKAVPMESIMQDIDWRAGNQKSV